MYTTGIAYLLWLLSGFGALGLHRFYLGKFGTGLIWLLTGGLGMVGGIFDLFYIPRMVRDANMRLTYREALFPGQPAPRPSVRNVSPSRETRDKDRPKESVEHSILRVAKKNHGTVTPAEIAIETEVSIDDAKAYLDTLVEKGHIELRVRKTGAVVYVVPEFLDEERQADLEDF